MNNTVMTVLLTLLCVANVSFLCLIAYAGRKADKTTKLGFGTIAMVVILNMFFSVGGVFLW